MMKGNPDEYLLVCLTLVLFLSQIEVGEIGPIYKVRVILDEDGDNEDKQSIFLEKVRYQLFH